MKILLNQNSIVVVATIQLFCGVFFAIDVLFEIYYSIKYIGAIDGQSYLHLILETFAVIVLVVGFFVSRSYERKLSLDSRKAEQKLVALRGHFDDIIQQMFRDWQLSPAERDVALLSLRGMRISDIAKARGTSEGTIKAQTSSIFRKAKVKTRNELLGLLMDEVLDFGAQSA